jgi:hypothetical protein
MSHAIEPTGQLRRSGILVESEVIEWSIFLDSRGNPG